MTRYFVSEVQHSNLVITVRYRKTRQPAVVFGLADDVIMVRRIDWSRLDVADRLAGTWSVADVRVPWVFLENDHFGTGDTIDLWTVPTSDSGESIFVPAGTLQAPRGPTELRPANLTLANLSLTGGIG